MAVGILPRLVSLVATGALVACVSAEAWAQPRPARTVLTIHWGAEDFPGLPVLDAAIRQALQSRPDAPVNYYTEFLESEAFPASSLALRDYIRQKYAARRIDLVIAITTPALDFALGYRRDLFPDVPIVFLAGAAPDRMIGRSVSGIT